VAYTAALQFAASWIALEDVQPGAGELFYYVGSHRLPDHLYAGSHKNQYDAARLSPECDIATETRATIRTCIAAAASWACEQRPCWSSEATP
jgi:hypothetical protein